MDYRVSFLFLLFFFYIGFSSCFFNFENNKVEDFKGCNMVVIGFDEDTNGSIVMKNDVIYVNKENVILNITNRTVDVVNYVLNITNKTIDVVNYSVNISNETINVSNISVNIVNITKDVLNERIDGSTIKEKLDIIFYGVVAVALVVVFSDEIRRRVMNR